MNKADFGNPRRTIQPVSGLVILNLILCVVDQVKAQSQSANSNNINNKNFGSVGAGKTMPSFVLDVIVNINAGGALSLQGDCRFTRHRLAAPAPQASG